MRSLTVVLILSLLPLAGCLNPDPLLEVNSTPQVYQTEPATELPARNFEPRLTLVTADGKVEYQSGDKVEFLFDVTDREDYSFPATFIDWGLFYHREPTPVAEGDANALPGNWSREFYGDAYHMIGFRAADGQGLDDFRVLIIQTGQPSGEYPDAVRLIQFKNQVLQYYGLPPIPYEIEEEVEAPVSTGDVVYEPTAISADILLYPSCSMSCTAGGTSFGHSLAAKACPGLHVNRQGWGCGFVEIPPGATGQIATISTNGLDLVAEFLDICAPHANRVGVRISPNVNQPETLVEVEIPAGAGCLMVWTEGVDQAAGDQGRTRVFVEVPEFDQPVSGEIPFELEPKLVHVDLGGTCNGGDVVAFGLEVVHTETGGDYMAGNAACPGLLAGPYRMAPTDGAWIAVDERFAGAAVSMYLTSGVERGDVSGLADEIGDEHVYIANTDCFFLDHMLNIIGEANNQGGPCAGFVPEGTHWLFVYSYNIPTYSMTTTFVLDGAVAATALDKVGDTLMADYVREGTYWRNIHTNICYLTDAPSNLIVTSVGDGVPGFTYVADGGWFFQETNGIPGLQVDGGSPYPDEFHDNSGAVGTFKYASPGCVFGDETTL